LRSVVEKRTWPLVLLVSLENLSRSFHAVGSLLDLHVRRRRKVAAHRAGETLRPPSSWPLGRAGRHESVASRVEIQPRAGERRIKIQPKCGVSGVSQKC